MSSLTRHEITAPVRLTSSAILELKRLLSERTDDSSYLRLGVKQGGCAGLSYLFEFDTISENDQLFHFDGISLIINPAHIIYIKGIEVDWSGGLNARGFIFNNPNASNTCGCGTSFAV